jgi:hypothetical protein
MKEGALLILFLVAISIAPLSVPFSATSVDKLSIHGIKGHAGDVIDIPITLKSTSDSERIGQLHTFYKEVEGDDEKMDIRSWITLTPANYTLKPEESKCFTISIRIPTNALPGAYGATSPDAHLEGHSDERRTYIVFEDAETSAMGTSGSGVKSGMLIPISVEVVKDASLFGAVKEAITSDAAVVMIGALCILLSTFVITMRRKQR